MKFIARSASTTVFSSFDLCSHAVVSLHDALPPIFSSICQPVRCSSLTMTRNTDRGYRCFLLHRIEIPFFSLSSFLFFFFTWMETRSVKLYFLLASFSFSSFLFLFSSREQDCRRLNFLNVDHLSGYNR